MGRACTISEPDLTLSITSATPTVGPVLSLNGSVIAESDGEIGIVATGFLTCSGSSPTPAGGISPDDCFNPTNTLAFNFGGGRLTATTLVSPVAVDAGQQIQVSVNIRFE